MADHTPTAIELIRVEGVTRQVEGLQLRRKPQSVARIATHCASPSSAGTGTDPPPALAALNPVASAHHEKCDRSGYHKRPRADTTDLGAFLLAATEIYAGLTTDRADRAAFSPGDAAAEPRGLAAEGALEFRATQAVLGAAGHGEVKPPTPSRPDNPAGLSRREVDVLRLATTGLTTQQIADKLFISAKTADHNIQHIYNKIGVSTRAAAALWAVQHAVVQ